MVSFTMKKEIDLEMLKTNAVRTMDMTKGPLLKNVLIFSMPIMLSGILQLVFNAADTIVVGKFSGVEALAAVGSVGSLNNLIVSLFIGLSVGVNVLVARYTGSCDTERISQTVHTAVLLALCGGLVLTVIGVTLAHPLLQLMGSPEDVIDLAVLYVRIIFVGMPIQMLYNFCAAVLRAIGDTRRPLYFLSIAGVINALLNLFFVIVLHMSVAGVALATVISQTVSAALIVHSLMTMDGPTRLNWRKLRLHKRVFKEIIRIGLPAGIQSSVFSLSNVVIQSSVNSFGSVVIAGNSAAMNVGNFVYQAMNTFQQAVTCFVGQNIGARKPDRVTMSVKVCLFWAFSFGVVLGLLSCVFGRPLLSLYNSEPDVIEAGLERIYIVCGPYFLCGIMDVMTGALRGIGYSMLPMIVSLLGSCVFRILWVVTVFAAHPSIACLMLSYPISWALTFVALLALYIPLWMRLVRTEFAVTQQPAAS